MPNVSIKKGDEIYCVHRKALDGGINPGNPIKGIILSITMRSNRQIGVQLDEQIAGGHDCEGRGEAGKCLWVKPWHILTPEEWALKQEESATAAERAVELDTEVDQLVLRNVN